MNKTSQLLLKLLFLFTIIIFSGCEQDSIESKQSNNSTVIASTSSSDTDTINNNNGSGYNDEVTAITTGNKYPVVLLHGFGGWGRDEAAGPLGHFYWGGYDDLQELLKKAGIDCYTSAVGPFSSNWDRACELYAQLKGTKVDYGLAHSIKNNHYRFGRDYTGKALLSNWGGNGKNRKIHIISHSQGGMTARVFAQLIEQGSDEEKKADYSGQEPISPFLNGSGETSNMICSISTLAAVHNGTTLANGIVKLIPLFQNIMMSIVKQIGVDSQNTLFKIYDFKMEQFGLVSRQKGETIDDYFTRINLAIETILNGDRKDYCIWDLSPEGCMEQNTWVHAQSNIYYFSFAGISSHPSKSILMRDNGEYYHIPDINSFTGWYAVGTMAGAYTCNDSRYHGYWRAKDGEFYHMAVADRVPIDSSWWPNDGVVNTISQRGPWLYPDNYSGTRDVIVDWDGSTIPVKGVWNYYGILKGFDHFDITGTEIFNWDYDYHPKNVISHIEDWYIERAKFLQTLPQ